MFLTHPDPMSSNDFKEVSKKFKENFDELLGHPLLSDLPPDITAEEIKSLIALENGQAISLTVKRFDEQSYSVIVNQKANVSDLKHAIKRSFELLSQRSNETKIISKISWKYVWKTFWLSCQGRKLKDDKKLLQDYGITNLDVINFVKRLKEK